MNIKHLALLILSAFILSGISCKSANPQKETAPQEEPEFQESAAPQEPEPQEEPPQEYNSDAEQAPPPAHEPLEEPLVGDEEFNRSTHDVDVTKEEFSNDKKDILEIIQELSTIMDEYNYTAWLKYIDNESKAYWSNPVNLRGASRRLPVKDLTIKNLNDYFKYVFIPSRKGRVIEEIRYISRNSVKAVQMRENQDIVFYYFVKQGGKWLVRIPPID